MPPPAQYAAAYPRKRFFIEMFTRDIALEDCILDLIDNSVDSLIRTRSLDLAADVAANKNIRSKAEISLELSGAKISISDNCGGIPITKARDEIFNFGHSVAGANELTKRGLGAYGIGLKRAIFKIGRKFRLDSSHDGSSFRVEQDIEEWVEKDDDIQDWRFPLLPKPLDQLDCCKNGTTINISRLYSSIHGLASNDAFVDSLCRSIARTYSFFLSRYAMVTVNGKEIEPVPMPVGDAADGYEPAVERYHDDDVDVYIKAGLAARGTRGEWQADRAGWYVLCNGRIVVSADKTQLTGWGAGILPTFHSSKARGFVGLANFTSANPLKLPWTTTKRGLDRESGVFLRARNKMQSVARPVYSYLESHYPTGCPAPNLVATRNDRLPSDSC